MWKQALIILGLFEALFLLLTTISDRIPDAIMLTANVAFASWLFMEVMRVRLGHAPTNSTTHGILSRSFLVISFISVILAFVDRGLNYPFRLPPLPDVPLVTGLLLFTGGVWLRYISIKTLGRFFVTKVQTTNDHQLIKNGVYRVLRHPSYTGLLLGFTGIILMLQSTIALALFLVVGIPAYLYRIRVEETALSRVFGEDYKHYRDETYALIPFIY